MKRKNNRRAKRLGEALTADEQFTWALIASGAGNKEIAYQRGVPEQAVSRTLRDLFEKTGLGNRVKLALLWHGVDADKALALAASIARDAGYAAAQIAPAATRELAA